MTFLLRAALVIGALSYLAMLRNGADPAAETRKLTGSAVAGAKATLPAALEAVPPESRAVRAVLARGLMAELSRRAGVDEPASNDTLEASDRQPAWHGPAEPR
ncbi:hypothetical protein [Methylobacterium sp. ARG-1]|uniref:hypothetical protein n=1 Tax=Methylobacterium sp. ARG-1 TaxID=1692501 RepID=UPI0006812723|nr:hypothetical protein [Methylobacterium sp. ARG-1]KNY24281.1 hypothetical protein AKJ13_03255 [Methylobacterium sp. ARG-1]